MEQDALHALYRCCQRELYLYLLSLCRNEALAEDLLQETFLKALLALPPGHPNIRAWLYRVARNLWLDFQRKNGRLVSTEEALEPRSTEDPVEKILTDERTCLLYEALSHLEPRKREVLQMQYFGGLTQKEIGSILQIKPEYVRVLAMRGRKELRKWMEGHGYDELS